MKELKHKPGKPLAISALLLILLIGVQNEVLAEPGWVLRQHTPVGLYNVFIARDKVRVEEIKTHYSIVSRAPEWKVCAYRNDKRTICEVTPQRWLSNGLFTMNERSLVKPIKPGIKPTTKILSKIKYLEYRLPLKNTRRFSNGRIVDIRGFMDSESTVKTIHSDHANFLVSPQISKNKKIIEFLGSLFVVPIGEGVPINFTIKYDNGIEHKPLMTSRIREANLADSLFSIPRGYKPVKDVQNITTGHRSGEIDDMIRDLGLGDSFGKSGKTSK